MITTDEHGRFVIHAQGETMNNPGCSLMVEVDGDPEPNGEWWATLEFTVKADAGICNEEVDILYGPGKVRARVQEVTGAIMVSSSDLIELAAYIQREAAKP